MPDNRIMIVEDEHIVALDIRKSIESFGYVVTGIHASGESALSASETEQPELVLMDIRLHGDLDGLETARLFRTEKGIPVVMLTAFTDDETLDRAKVSQPSAYVVKPFDRRELRTAIVMSLSRHSLEQQLLERESLFSTTLESIVDAVIVTDTVGQIEFLNPIACSMLGISPDDAVGQEITRLVGFEQPLEVRESAPGDRTGEITTVVLGDGKRIPVESTRAPVRQGESQRGWVWVLHDISRRIEAERQAREQSERLKRSQKMEAIGRLTGGIAHDFNNLLTVIMGYSRLIVDELEDLGEDLRRAIVEDVEGIQKAALRSAGLTKQLLSFSRSQNVDREVTDLGETIRRLQPLLGQLLKEDVSLTMDLTGGATTVYMDPSQLEQVVMNLVVNARDAMPDGGRLLIRTEGKRVGIPDVIGRDGVSPGEFVVLTVTDSGMGMDGDTLERIFDPFFTTKASGKGTGLGLSTVYGIVSQAGGYVEAESEPGSGTAFTVAIPAYLDVGADVGPLSIVAEAESRGETILLVEDDDSIRKLAARILRQKGYVILDASNAGEALLEAENHTGTIHLLLSDVIMPLMSGIKLAARLRETRPEVKVILMSGYPDSALSDQECKRLELEFLQKPVEPEVLTRRIREILDG